MWPRIPVSVYVGVIFALAASVASWQINGAIWQSKLNAERLEHSQALAAGYKASLEKYAEANRRALEAEKKIRDTMIRAGEQRKKYEQLLKENPSCAAQDAQPLLCKPW